MPDDIFKWPRSECPVCDSTKTLSFPLDRARDEGGDLGLLRVANTVLPERPLKRGHLHRCRLCGLGWYLDPHRILYRVPTTQEELLADWSARDLTPSVEQREAMAAIGGAGRDPSWSRWNMIRVPARLTWADGGVTDPSLLTVSSLPPVDSWYADAELFGDVRRVEPSEYALPVDVRRATYDAYELGMGWAPTDLESIDGRSFTVNGATDLFAYGDLRGRDLRLAHSSARSGGPIIVRTTIETSLVWVDPWPGVRGELGLES